MQAPYIHFRSSYSLLRGCRSPEEICRFARERNLPEVGIADINSFYGLIRFLLAARREGVKPVAGVVIESGGRRLLTAFVMNRAGFGRACAIVSGVLRGGAAGCDPVADLRENGWEGLAILTPHPDVAAALAERGGARGNSSLYVQLTYGRPFAALARFAREKGLPTAAIHDTVFLDEADERLYPLLRAIDLNVTVGQLRAGEAGKGEEWPAKHNAFAGLPAMESFFSAVPEALRNSRDIADAASTEGIISPRFIFPPFEGLTDGESFALLGRLCEEGAVRRCGGMRPDIRARLDYELSIIREKGFASYFLVVRDIVRQCPRTCGRGSAAASIVSFLLGITHVDPLRYNLFFERFLNRGRKDPPDIDVDFPWDERDRMLKYVFEKYPGRSAMVANHVTLGPRSSIRDCAKAMGIAEEEIARLVRSFRMGRIDEIPSALREAAARVRGMPRNLGTHCGGVVITPGPLTDYTTVQASPLGYPVIAWEKDATEEAGLVKIDLLGNRSLAVLRDTIALVAAGGGERIDWESFDPLQDADTRDLIASGRTIGVFYVESPATRQLLAKMRVGDYENLVIASSIIRPAANPYIRTFVKRLHGAAYRPLHPLIGQTLAETFGVLVYQEDVSRVAIDLAGFPIEDADRLRKILSKKDRELTLPDYREKFFRGARARGVAEETIGRVWEMILSFDGYSFCKPHSASYAQVSYRVAWMKRFHPLEFIASVINNGGGFYGRQTYVDECRRLGFPVLPPDVNASSWEYTVERGAGPAPGGAGPGAGPGAQTAALRVGLGQLKDLRREFVDALLAERARGGPFGGFRDFLLRTGAPYPDLRVLIRSGALDSIAEGYTRPQMFFRHLHMDSEAGFGFLPPPPPLVGDYSPRVKLADEVRTMGIVVSRHPMELFRGRVERMVRRHRLSPFIRSPDIPSRRGQKVWIGGILVTGKEVATKESEPMIFVSFEDEQSVFETVLFPDSFRRHFALLDEGWAFLVYGRVDEDLGALAITVERLVQVSRRAGEGERAGAEACGTGAACASPERPPVFLWGRGPSGSGPAPAPHAAALPKAAG